MALVSIVRTFQKSENLSGWQCPPDAIPNRLGYYDGTLGLMCYRDSPEDLSGQADGVKGAEDGKTPIAMAMGAWEHQNFRD